MTAESLLDSRPLTYQNSIFVDTSQNHNVHGLKKGKKELVRALTSLVLAQLCCFSLTAFKGTSGVELSLGER